MGAKVLSRVCYLGSNSPNDGLNHFLKFLSLGFHLEKLLKSGSRDIKQVLLRRTSIAYIHQSNFKRRYYVHRRWNSQILSLLSMLYSKKGRNLRHNAGLDFVPVLSIDSRHCTNKRNTKHFVRIHTIAKFINMHNENKLQKNKPNNLK